MPLRIFDGVRYYTLSTKDMNLINMNILESITDGINDDNYLIYHYFSTILGASFILSYLYRKYGNLNSSSIKCCVLPYQIPEDVLDKIKHASR